MIGRFLAVVLGTSLPVGLACYWLQAGPLLTFISSATATLLVMTFLIDWVAGE